LLNKLVSRFLAVVEPGIVALASSDCLAVKFGMTAIRPG
jgi:hypothetical protein